MLDGIYLYIYLRSLVLKEHRQSDANKGKGEYRGKGEYQGREEYQGKGEETGLGIPLFTLLQGKHLDLFVIYIVIITLSNSNNQCNAQECGAAFDATLFSRKFCVDSS